MRCNFLLISHLNQNGYHVKLLVLILSFFVVFHIDHGTFRVNKMSFLLTKVADLNHLWYDKVLWFLSWNKFFLLKEKYFVLKLLKSLIVIVVYLFLLIILDRYNKSLTFIN